MATTFRIAKLILASVASVLGFAACDSPSQYQKKDDQWFYDSQKLGVAATVPLTVLGASFARVGDQIFYRYDAIEGADNASFVALDAYYGKDKARAYFGDTYRDARDYFLVKKNRVFTVVGADAASFRVLRDSYAADTARPYYKGKPFNVRDVASFEVLDHGFSRDRVRGYSARTEIAGSDGATFISLDPEYARDANRVYYAFVENQTTGGQMLPTVTVIAGADAASFVAKTGGYAADTRHLYFCGRAISTSPDGFERLSLSYARTASEVFHDGERVVGADASSFKVSQPPEEGVDAADDKARYLRGKRI